MSRPEYAGGKGMIYGEAIFKLRGNDIFMW